MSADVTDEYRKPVVSGLNGPGGRSGKRATPSARRRTLADGDPTVRLRGAETTSTATEATLGHRPRRLGHRRQPSPRRGLPTWCMASRHRDVWHVLDRRHDAHRAVHPRPCLSETPTELGVLRLRERPVADRSTSPRPDRVPCRPVTADCCRAPRLRYGVILMLVPRRGRWSRCRRGRPRSYRPGRRFRSFLPCRRRRPRCHRAPPVAVDSPDACPQAGRPTTTAAR